jgi:cell division protein ZapD
VRRTPRPAGARGLIVYEQPLTERMRTFLRIEFLSRQAQHHARQPSAWSSRAAMGSLIEILAIVSRGDVRGEVLKDLERQATMLAGFASRPGVDRTRLDALLERVSQLRQQLSSCGAHYTQPLKESEFLASIRHRSAIPGGTCEFDLPDFKHWLSLPGRAALRRLPGLVPPPEAAVRRHRPAALADPRVLAGPARIAPGGMFQYQIDRSMGCQLVRIALPPAQLLPRDQRRAASLHGALPDLGRPGAAAVQVTENVEFELTCC